MDTEHIFYGRTYGLNIPQRYFTRLLVVKNNE
jgi:hypothetical protein